MINLNTLRLLLLYCLFIGVQQLLKNTIPIDKTLQFVIVMFAPPNVWLIIAILKNGNKFKF